MTTPHNNEPPTPWYRVPVLWLAGLALLASLLGCIVNIVIALDHADNALAEVAPRSRFQLPTTSSPQQSQDHGQR